MTTQKSTMHDIETQQKLSTFSKIASRSTSFGIYNPMVFSRTKTYTNPAKFTTVTSAADLVTQSDKHGNTPTHFKANTQNVSTTQHSDAQQNIGGLSRMFASFCSCIGLGETDKTQLHQSPQQVLSAPESSLLLPPIDSKDAGKKCLVLDLDETLVHSSFRPTQNPDYIIPVEIEGTIHRVYVTKRPGVDDFLRAMGEHYEIVVYTASLSKYADPLLDKLDTHQVIRHRLFREHCVSHNGNYVKDLSLLRRDIAQVIIVDNSPAAYMFHPSSAIGCTSFIDDMNDRELASISSFLKEIVLCEDVRDHLHRWTPTYTVVG